MKKWDQLNKPWLQVQFQYLRVSLVPYSLPTVVQFDVHKSCYNHNYFFFKHTRNGLLNHIINTTDITLYTSPKTRI